jgi:hypothetical protein
MHVNMFPRVTLTEDVGALEMMKRDFDFPPAAAALAAFSSASYASRSARFMLQPRGLVQRRRDTSGAARTYSLAAASSSIQRPMAS